MCNRTSILARDRPSLPDPSRPPILCPPERRAEEDSNHFPAYRLSRQRRGEDAVPGDLRGSGSSHLSQERRPFYESLVTHAARGRRRFHVPGHKGAGGRYEDLAGILGPGPFRLDLTELDELDDLHHPRPGGPLDQAQTLAAEAYGAGEARFLAGGATAGILAMIVATVGPGDTLLVCHPFHRSVVAAALLAGCALRVVPPALTQSLIPLPPSAETISRELAVTGPAALLVTSPTYHGAVADLAGLTQACLDQEVPLLVDAAHGAHFGHSSSLPPSPVRQGAAACVVSLHKTAGALTPGAILLMGQATQTNGAGLCPERVDSALRFVQTSSPSFVTMASLDLARHRLAVDGETDWGRTVALCEATRTQVERESRGLLLASDRSVGRGVLFDPTRLVFELTGEAPGDLTGLGVARAASQAGVDLEMAGWATVVAVATPGDTEDDLRRLASALVEATCGSRAGHGENGPLPRRESALSLEKDCWKAPNEIVLPLAEAFRRPRHRAPLARSVGCVAADVVSPCPPGVPLILPGWAISPEAVRYLDFLGQSGVRVQGVSSRGVEVVD